MATVALLNHTGNLGKHILPPLLKAHNEGSIKLVILHRDQSNTSIIPEGIEKRVIDLENGSTESIEKAVEGIEALISAVPSQSVTLELKLVKALAKSQSLKVYIPSEFGCVWTDEELANPSLGFLQTKRSVHDCIHSLGVPSAFIHNGAFLEFVFGFKFIDVKSNKIDVYKDGLRNPYYLSTFPAVGEATANLVISAASNLSSIAHKTYNFIQYSPTGSDLAEILTKLHGGKKTEIVEYTEADYQAGISSPGLAALVPAIRRKWGVNDWAWKGKIEAGPGVSVGSLEDEVKKYL